MPRSYPAEFRRQVIELARSGTRVKQLVVTFEMSDATIYNWLKQDRIDRGEAEGATTSRQLELAAAKRRIRQLETELAVSRKVNEVFLEQGSPQKPLPGDRVPDRAGNQCAARVTHARRLRVWLLRLERSSDAPRTLRRIWLAGEIADVHKASAGTYGALRITAELRYGRGIGSAWRGRLIMRELGIKGLPTRRLPRGAKGRRSTRLTWSAGVFRSDPPNELWMTDITEHPTREGKVYCSVVLDVFSRLVVGWSIDSTQTTTLVLNALGMATQRRQDREGWCQHRQGAQTRLNRSSQHWFVDVTVNIRRALLQGFASRVSCAVGC